MRSPKKQPQIEVYEVYQFTNVVLFQLLFLGLAVYSCFHWTQNPRAVTIIAAILTFGIVITRYDIILANEKAVSFRKGNPILPFFSTSRKIRLDGIAAIHARLEPRTWRLVDVLGTHYMNYTFENTLTIVLRNGTKRTFSTQVDQHKIRKVLAFIRDHQPHPIAFSEAQL